ncbi:hypothetical protein [Xanthomonas hortorum]|uniref:hypothetical protein n=1 Tax=Xanthomonas hortorum TaxID=56454 RepID=UPI00131ED64D|nr:hypothetical protein [Xanthomonas hortorum]
MTKFIVDVVQIDPADAMAALVLKRADLDTCKVGWGWSGWVRGRKAFMCRTKAGYSIKESRS